MLTKHASLPQPKIYYGGVDLLCIAERCGSPVGYRDPFRVREGRRDRCDNARARGMCHNPSVENYKSDLSWGLRRWLGRRIAPQTIFPNHLNVWA